MHANLLAAICTAFALLLSMTPTGAAETTPPLVLHVAANGSDGWSGQLEAPTAAKTDGPAATLGGARDAIRRLRSTTAADLGPITVRVHPGTYTLPEPFVLEPRDSGTDTAPVVYEAVDEGRAVFSGGRVLTGFRSRGNLWECEIPEVKAGAWYFRQLWVNGRRAQRARSPNTGYHRIATLIPGPPIPNAKPVARDRFGFTPGDLQPWPRLQDVNVILMHSWETSIHPLQSVDADSNIVHFVAPMKEWWSIGYWEDQQRYYVENAFELLDQPGEWYLNRETGVLSYWPLPGEEPDRTRIIAPRLTELVRFAGNADEGRLVQHLTLRGLTFHHADWILHPNGNSSTQAAVEEPAAIMADGARHCAIEGGELAHVGAYGIWFRRGCKHNRIAHNRLFDLGAGGVRIGEANMARTDEAESSGNVVDNNHIFDGGHVFAAGIGIWVAQSSFNRISHNVIHDLLYSGLSIGWNWNDAPNRTHHNVIEFNHVHHLVNGVLSDAGAIYTLGVSPGSVIRNNVFHDVWPYAQPPFGWGIYLDATCGGYLVESNIVYHTRSGGLMYNNGGHDHVVRNNVFALNADFTLWPFWEKRPNTFERNIVFLTQGELIRPYAETTLRQRLAAGDSLGTWDRNLYWHPDGSDAVRFFRHTFEEWQALGLDQHSLIADPRFVDSANTDFRLRADSPAFELGFQAIDTSRVGLYGDAAWVNEARQVRHPQTRLPEPPPSPKPMAVHDDFETTPPGSPPANATVSGEERGASIRVTMEQAAGGRQSLKVTDAASLEPSWQPHFFYQPHFTSGTIRQSFDLRLATSSLLFVEWRDATSYPDCVGPSVSFNGRGEVWVAGKSLTTVPVGQWVTVEIRARLGKNAPRTFSLSVMPAGAEPQAFRDLPMAGKTFRELHWAGFSSTASADTAFHIDNLHIDRADP